MQPNALSKFKPQKISYFHNAIVVHLVDFPIYYIERISERHFIIAGGGGSSKTGVHNQINILELVPMGESCTADLVMKYHTPDEVPDAIMTGSLMRDLPIVSTRLVTGGSNATIYDISFDSQKKNFTISDFDIVRSSMVTSEVKSVKSIPGGILTGGLDGQLALWDVSTNYTKLIHHIQAHKKAIDDIDYDPVNQQIVTLSRDESRCVVWKVPDLKLVQEFKREYINPPNNDPQSTRYGYRACKYAFDASTEGSKESRGSHLLIACNPIPAKGQSKVYRIDTRNVKDFKCMPVTSEGIMAMTISPDGQLLAIGTRSGSVSVFWVKSMKQVYSVTTVHHNAITNLEFLTPQEESLHLANSKMCPLLSVSIDRRIVLHRPKKRSLTTNVLLILFMVLLMYLVFFILHRNYLSGHVSGNSEM